MPSESIREQLMQNIVNTIGAITEGATYHHTILPARVFRNIQGVPTVLEFPTVLLNVTDAPDGDGETSVNGDLVDRILTLDIRLTGSQSEGLLSERIEEHLTDIMIAMDADHTRGGLAFDQDPPTIEEPDFSEVFQDHVSVSVIYPIHYRVRRSNPTLQ